MKTGLEVLCALAKEDVEWILDQGQERQVIANTVLMKEGEVPDGLCFVLEGLIEVRIQGLEDQSPSLLGPGELLGEMSFVEEREASATARAAENSLILEIPMSVLRSRVHACPEFGRRIYQVFAAATSRRLRQRENRLVELKRETDRRGSQSSTVSAQLDALLGEFKETMHDVDRKAIQSGGVVVGDDEHRVLQGFRDFSVHLNDLIGDDADLPDAVREELGLKVRREALPFLLLTKTAERLYSKPRGYAGDFLSIEWIYQNVAAGSGRLGPLLDRAFLDEPAARSVRNRRGLLTQEIRRHVDEKKGRKVRILSMACGPAQEIFDVLEDVDPSTLEVTLIDIHQQALAFVREEVERRGLGDVFRFCHANLVYLSLGRQKLDLPPQDLIYSIGLIDYFSDKFVSKLMDYGHANLREGGEMILGNFHARNSDKALMDHVLDWKLIHRSEEDMDLLYEQSAFGQPCTRIRFEEAYVNLFAGCAKS